MSNTIRKAVSNKIRFEVFKRDKFTCQYCGAKAPEVVLECDHIDPVSRGGTNELMNLVTACFKCNRGKSNKTLSDSSVIEKKLRQMEELQERREQLDLLYQWQKELINLEDECAIKLAKFWKELTGGYSLNETGMEDINKLRKRYKPEEIMEAMSKSAKHYLIWQDDISTLLSALHAWSKVGGVCKLTRKTKDIPQIKEVYYIKKILLSRFRSVNEGIVIKRLTKLLLKGVSMTYLEEHAKCAKNWSEWRSEVESLGELPLKEIPEIALKKETLSRENQKPHPLEN